jgi:hypothetical protein
MTLTAAALFDSLSLAQGRQTPGTWTPPLTSWGDPDLTGRWPERDAGSTAR